MTGKEISKKERDHKIREWFAKRKEKFKDNVSMRVAHHYVPHWMLVCGVDDPNDIDYSRTDISLEYFLCDADVIYKLTHGKRDEVLPLMGDAERELYLTGVDYSGHRYTEIEGMDYDKEMKKAARKNRVKR